jgi:hypothetical protein
MNSEVHSALRGLIQTVSSMDAAKSLHGRIHGVFESSLVAQNGRHAQ